MAFKRACPLLQGAPPVGRDKVDLHVLPLSSEEMYTFEGHIHSLGNSILPSLRRVSKGLEKEVEGVNFLGSSSFLEGWDHVRAYWMCRSSNPLQTYRNKNSRDGVWQCEF